MLTRSLMAVALACVLGATGARADDITLAGSKISLKDGKSPSKRRVTFQGRFSANLGTMSPNDGSTLRVYGAPGEGDSGLIRLGPNWRTLKGKGFHYVDKTQSAGGIQSIVLRTSSHGGGHIKIVGGAAHWAYQVTKAQSAVTVLLTIGTDKLCTQFASPKTRKQRVTGFAPKALAACPCDKFDSTWDAIQSEIFARQGCTNQTCHGSDVGAAASGGLKLTPDVAFENLVGVYSQLGHMNRVQPGSPTNDSFLYRKLAAKTKGLAGVPGTPMPSGLPAISADELEALRLWIQYSAKKDGVVAGTEGLLNSCLPPAKPPHLDPPAAPVAGEGVQYHAPQWNIAPHKEDEGCYATYASVADQIPDEYKTPCPDLWGGPTKTCYFFNKTELTQEPNSHHSIIHIYRGAFGLDAPGMGHYCKGGDADKRNKACDPSNPGVAAPAGDQCGAGGSCVDGFNFHCGGTSDGAACDPRVPDVCGAGVTCSGVFRTSLACLDFGPPDYGGLSGALTGTGSANAPQVGGSQQPFSRAAYPDGVFGVYPAEAIWVWNSHAFNLTDDPTYNQQWYNVYFAPPADREYPIRGVFDADDIFVEDVPPFHENEYCRTITFAVGTRLFELSSHTHSRARLFRTWGPGITPRCRSTRANPGTCVAETGTPIAVTTQYNDPTLLRFDPPLPLDDPDPAKRTFKFCGLYDNGYSDPNKVKRNSTSPMPPTVGALAGGPCLIPGSGGFTRNFGIVCMNEAKRGQACGTTSAPFQSDDHACDSAPGANDGICDACPIQGGVTTQDEMFIPLGSYYCDPTVPGETCTGGMCGNAAAWGQGCHTDADCGPGGNCEGYIN